MAGDTFDAGTVLAEARLDRDEFQRDLDQLRRDMAKFERQQFRVHLGTDNAGVDSGVSDATKKVRGLDREKAEPKVGADTRTFMQRMLGVRQTLKQVSEIVAAPLIVVEIVQSLARIAKLKYELADLTKQYVIDLVIFPQVFQEVNRIADGLLSLKNVARSTIPVLFPLLGAAAGGAAVLASSLAGAGAAAGVFALAAVPALVGVVEKSKEIEEAQKKVSEAITDEQRKTALRDLELALGAVSEKERQAVTDVGLIKQAWRDFQSSIQPAVFGLLNNSVGLISKLLPPLVPVVEAVARVMNGWIDDMEAAIDRGGLARFTSWLSNDGVTSLDAWARALANFGSGTMNVLMSAGVQARFFEQGILGASRSFLEWSQSLASNQQWQEFLTFTQTALPDVLFILGDLLRLLWEVHRVFAPITLVVLEFVAGFMRAHPELTRFLVVGFAISQMVMGLLALIAGITIKILLFAAIFGRIAAVMAIARTAGLLWGAVMAGQFAMILPLLRTLITQIWRLSAIGRLFAFITAAVQAWTWAQWLLNAAMSANPIGIIIVAVAALIAALVLLWHNSETFRNIVTAAWERVKQTAIDTWENGIKPIVEWIVGAWNTLVSAAQAAGQWIVEAWNNVVWFFESLPGWIMGALRWLGQTIADGATAAWNWLVNAAITAGTAVVDFVQKLPERIAYALGFLAGFLVRSAIDSWNNFTRGIEIAWEATAQWFTELPGRIESFLSDLGSWFARTATDAWDQFTGGIETAWEATAAWFVALPDRIGSFFLGLGLAIWGFASDAWSQFTAGVVSAWDDTVAWFVALPDRVVEYLAGLGATLQDQGSQSWDQFTEGVTSAWDATAAWFVALPGRIGEFFVGAGTWLWQFGQDIWGGLIGGLQAAWDGVVSWWNNLINSFIQGFKDAMGIASPSALFRDFGVWILEGLLNGLVAFGQQVIDWILGFGRLLVDGFMASTRFVFDLWNNFWDLLQRGAQAALDFINSIISTALSWIEDTFGVSMASVRAGWDAFWAFLRSVAETVFLAIRAVIDVAWTVISGLFAAAQAALSGNWEAFWAILRATADFAWAAVRAGIEFIWGLIRAGFSAAIAFIQGIWQGFWGFISSVASTVFNGVRTTIDTVTRGIVSAFEWVVEQVGRIWSGIRRLLASPINFLINTVYNNGIVRAWNFVADILPGIGRIGTISPIPEFAKGGPVTSDTILRAGERGHEYILSNPAVQRLGGIRAVDQMHRALVREPLSVKQLNTGRYVEGADHEGPGISSVGFGGVKPHVARAGHYLGRRFGVSSIGGVGQRTNASDHPRGLALDFMTYRDTAKGDRLVNYLLPNAGHFAVKYIIWKQQINSGSGWRRMADRGSVTANHFDHPHVSFLDGPGGGGGFGGGGFVDFLLQQVRGIYDGITGPLVGALRGAIGAPPPRFRAIPPEMASKAIKDVGDFLFGQASGGGGPSADGSRVGGGGTFDNGGVIQPGWNAIYNGTGKPELAGRLDQWASLIDSSRVARPGAGDSPALERLAERIAAVVAEAGPLVGTMNVGETGRASAPELADEVLYKLQRVRRGGVHSGRPR